MAQAENKTRPSGASVADYIDAVEPARKRDEARALDALFQSVTGWQPVLWGPSIIGYGRYEYRYESGHEGEAPATGFSPRKAQHSLYILSGYMSGQEDDSELLSRLGKHSRGKSCLYVRKLDDIDMDVLAELIRAGLADLGRRWPVHAA